MKPKPPGAPRSSMARPAPQPTAPARIGIVDAGRGVAIVAMVIYHLAYDLRMFGALRADFEHDPAWLATRAAILSSFLALCGVSLALAGRSGLPAAAFRRRLAAIAGCAVLVSIATYVAFPRSFVYFGVLHCIVVASLLGFALVRIPIPAIFAGIVVIVAGTALAHPAFDARPLSWLGFNTVKPITVDYVPVFPWAGVTLVALGIMGVLTRRGLDAPLARLRSPRSLRWLGRHSLAIYMLHQPVLLVLLWLALR